MPLYLESVPHLDMPDDVKLEEDDLDHAEADHEVARVLLALDECAVAADEVVAKTLESRARMGHEVVEEDVDGVPDRLRVSLQSDRRQSSV